MTNVLNLLAIILAIMAFITSLISIVMVLAQRWSTHKIEWKPLVLEDPLNTGEEATESDEEESKFLDNALDLQRTKKKKEKIEDPLDEIASVSHQF